MIRLRAVFEKSGRAKYISHLDLNRCILRIFKRSKLPVWYTEGFNPHPYVSFALALSLGFESDCEIMDFNINEDIPLDTVKDRLNSVMPEGMHISSVTEQKKKITEITNAEYEMTLSCESPDALMHDINMLMSQDEIFIDKKTKKGMKSVDLKPSIDIIKVTPSDKTIILTMRLPAGTQTNYNPTLFLNALKDSYNSAFEIENIRRTGILCGNGEIFS